MINVLGRIPLRLPKSMLILCALTLCVADASDVGSKAFVGHWAYSNDCNLGHYAELKLVQQGDSVTGDWSDGSRVEGWDGTLKGRILDRKLIAKYCSTEPNGGHAVCPSYDVRESDYFTREGNDLVWYRAVGQGAAISFDKYVVLHPSIKGKPDPVDGNCPSNEN
ncbi:MAG: hypothetical protein M3Y27_05635 [Acidobacteriota bacterium]|nr:hypothetical protein [Acidobacteriota bacterium]